MGKVTGFLEYKRQNAARRPATERVKDYREFELPVVGQDLQAQAARCMDCGVPFCNTGCPLGNLIPDWNDHVYSNQPEQAIQALHATNNFPEFTGRVCPAPCEAACVLGINEDPVSIKLIERSIADQAWSDEHILPEPASHKTGKKVAIVGSGPAGMAAAQQLARAGHDVTLFERDDRVGGLLTYGIPDFKLEKWLVQRRVDQLEAEGVSIRTGVNVGQDITGDQLRAEYDAVCLCGGSRTPRDLDVPGRGVEGVHFAMEFLEQQNRRVAGLPITGPELLATGKHVVVLGGGDTGSDCIGTSHRQGAAHITSFEIMPQPPAEPSPSTPWPLWPLKMRSSSSHEEGGERDWAVSTLEVLSEGGAVSGLRCVRVELKGGRFESIPGTEFDVKADLVLLAMGFVHPEHGGILEQLGVALNQRGNVQTDHQMMSSVPGVFSAGDMQRGQSLVVWAIADGRRAAREIDLYLSGQSALEEPGRAGQLR